MLRRLDLKDAEWCWLPVHDEAVQSIKKLVCKAPVLKFYDFNKTSTREVTFESDTSLSGLGATLLQEGQPVAFASKVLTPAESRYARIEKELLSVFFLLVKGSIRTRMVEMWYMLKQIISPLNLF